MSRRDSSDAKHTSYSRTTRVAGGKHHKTMKMIKDMRVRAYETESRESLTVSYAIHNHELNAEEIAQQKRRIARKEYEKQSVVFGDDCFEYEYRLVPFSDSGDYIRYYDQYALRYDFARDYDAEQRDASTDATADRILAAITFDADDDTTDETNTVERVKTRRRATVRVNADRSNVCSKCFSVFSSRMRCACD